MEFINKVAQKKDKKRKDLLNSAYELFTTIGFTKTTILAIALNAGVAKGTFYLYFDSKEQVRDELIRIRSSELLLEAASALEAEKSKTDKHMKAADQVVFLADYILNVLEQDITLLKFISKNLNWSTLDSAKSEKDEDIEVVNFHEFIAEGLEKDGITLRDPELLIYTILELVNSTCYNVILEKEPVSIEEYKPYLYGIIRSVVSNSVISE